MITILFFSAYLSVPLANWATSHHLNHHHKIDEPAELGLGLSSLSVPAEHHHQFLILNQAAISPIHQRGSDGPIFYKNVITFYPNVCFKSTLSRAENRTRPFYRWRFIGDTPDRYRVLPLVI